MGPDQLCGYAERLVGNHGPNYPGGASAPRGPLEGTAGPARISLQHSGVGQNGYEVHDEYVTELIVYTSDHGEQVGEHGLWWKQTFYEQ
ncbi:MAG TPA: hypothetical protein VIU62_05035, partial [Chloroflexota bacterium]